VLFSGFLHVIFAIMFVAVSVGVPNRLDIAENRAIVRSARAFENAYHGVRMMFVLFRAFDAGKAVRADETASQLEAGLRGDFRAEDCFKGRLEIPPFRQRIWAVLAPLVIEQRRCGSNDAVALITISHGNREDGCDFFLRAQAFTVAHQNGAGRRIEEVHGAQHQLQRIPFLADHDIEGLSFFLETFARLLAQGEHGGN